MGRSINPDFSVSSSLVFVKRFKRTLMIAKTLPIGVWLTVRNVPRDATDQDVQAYFHEAGIELNLEQGESRLRRRSSSRPQSSAAWL
jgi:hypothetical protein